MVTRSATTLKGKALQLLALRDYSRAELQAKLLRWLRTQTVKQAAQQASQQAKQMAGGTHMHAQAREHARGQPDVDADNAGYYLPDDTDDLSEHVLSSEAEASENHASELAQQHKQIAAVLDELQAKGWLDDRRAAEALLHQRSARRAHPPAPGVAAKRHRCRYQPRAAARSRPDRIGTRARPVAKKIRHAAHYARRARPPDALFGQPRLQRCYHPAHHAAHT